jgi:hypothetical protein
VNKSSATNPNAITTTITFKTTGKPPDTSLHISGAGARLPSPFSVQFLPTLDVGGGGSYPA